MHFVTYKSNNMSKHKVGILDEAKTRIFPLKKIYDMFQQKYQLGNQPQDMQSLIEVADDQLIQKLSDLTHKKEIQSSTVMLREVMLCAPIPYPRRNVFCVGKNYLDHVQELGSDFGDNTSHPVFFSKVAYPAVGDGYEIPSNRGTTAEIDYEVELAIIIGKKGKNIHKDRVQDHIFGYTILNDITARDLQRRHSQWNKGKSLDAFCPMGPILVYKKAFSFPPNLCIQSRVNGELRQESNTKNMIFDIPTLIHSLSQGLTLFPGDIIATGTPSGVGMGFEPPRYLKSGDTITCIIENIGVLENTIG